MRVGTLWRKLVFFIRRDRAMAELHEEMRLHAELRASQLSETGLAPSEAEQHARRSFGNRAALGERSGDEWGLRWAESFRRDVRHGFRSLRRTPWATAAIVLSLALVIGANTTIFGLLHSVLLRRLPLTDAEHLISVEPVEGGGQAIITYSKFTVLRDAPGVPRIGAYRFEPATVSLRDFHQNVWVDAVSGGFFEVLGASPVAGRTISRDDEVTRAPVAVISGQLRERLFDSDSAALGQTIHVGSPDGGIALTVVGVMPPEYSGLHFARPAFAVAIPVTVTAAGWAVDVLSLELFARLDAGRTQAHAAPPLDAAFQLCCVNQGEITNSVGGVASTRRFVPVGNAPTAASRVPPEAADGRTRVIIRDVSRGMTWGPDYREQYGRLLLLLMGGVVTLALIGCANVGTLLLSRAAAREREFAVRMSLGASRGRLARQLLTESIELAVLGGIGGLALAWWGTPVLLSYLPSRAALLTEAAAWHANPSILAFTLAMVVGSTLLFGVWPIRRATRVDIVMPLTGADRATSAARLGRSDRGLVVTQVALALTLVSAATLVVATLRNLTALDGGFRSTNVVVARVNADDEQEDGARLRARLEVLIDGLRHLPDVVGAAASFSVPVINESISAARFRIPGYDSVPGERMSARYNPVTAGFFGVTGIGIARGRDFDDNDRADGEPVAIVSEAFARKYFAGRDPIGATVNRVSTGRPEIPFRVVGIARDARYDELRGPASVVWYIPMPQARALGVGRSLSLMFAVRTAGDPQKVTPLVRAVIEKETADGQLYRIATVQQLLDDVAARERLAAVLASLFGLTALALAALGLYGLISYHTARRTREIGIRMALGARAADVLGLVMGQTLRLVCLGVVIGLPLAYGAGLVIRAHLFGITPGDPRVFAASAAALILVAVVASCVPGRRAARVDPALAVRTEQ